MAAPPWIPGGVVGWPPTGLAGVMHARLLGFVKTALLRQLVSPNSLVCDLFCGRGLDTERWAKAGIGRYVGVDFSASALEEAREQWEQHGRPFPAEFCELDPCMVDLEVRLQDQGLPADVVCCLAHLQDSFTSEVMVRRLLKNVEAVLKPGGFFFGTAPDSSTIWYKYQKAVEGAMKAGSLRVNGTLPSVRTEFYKISFDDDRFNAFGSKYHMRFTDDGLPAQPQLLVHFPSLIRLAKEVGLECVEIQNLCEFYDDYSGPYADVLRSCCGSLVDPKGGPVLDAKGRLNSHAVDVLSLYTSFIFKKGDSTSLIFRVSPTLDHEAFNSAVKYPRNSPPQQFESFSYKMNEDPARKEHHAIEVEDHDPYTTTNVTISGVHHREQLQHDSNAPNNEDHIVDPVEDLSESGAHHATWHDHEEGASEVMQEGPAGERRDENIGVVGNHNEGPSTQDLEMNHSKRSSGLLAQTHILPNNGARPSSLMERDDSHRSSCVSMGRRTFKGSNKFGACTSTDWGQVSLMEIGTPEELPLVDHISEDYVLRTNESPNKINADEKLPESPLADHNPKHYMRRTQENVDESRGEKQRELAPGDHNLKHYLRRNSESRDEASRHKNEPEPPVADHTSKHHKRKTHESSELSTGRDRWHEPPPADLTSRLYELKATESLEESDLSAKQQAVSPADDISNDNLGSSNEEPDLTGRYDEQHELQSAELASEGRAHESLEESNRKAKQQELPPTPWRASESLEASRRHDKQQEPRSLGLSSKLGERRAHESLEERNRSAQQKQRQVDHPCNTHLRRSNNILNLSNIRDKQQEPPLANITAKQYGRKSLDESNRSARRREPPADHTSKHKMRRATDNSDESSRSEHSHEERNSGENGRVKRLGRYGSHKDLHGVSEVLHGRKSSLVGLKKFTVNSSKPNATMIHDNMTNPV